MKCNEALKIMQKKEKKTQKSFEEQNSYSLNFRDYDEEFYMADNDIQENSTPRYATLKSEVKGISIRGRLDERNTFSRSNKGNKMCGC